MEQVEIISRSLPFNLALYDRKQNKIFINPITDNYPKVKKYLLEHEMEHYKIEQRWSFPIVFLFHLILEWKDFFKALNPNLFFEAWKCNNEFYTLTFSSEEIEQYNEEFYLSVSGREKIVWHVYSFFRPDGYAPFIFLGYLFPIFLPWLKLIAPWYLYLFLFMFIPLSIQNRVRIKNWINLQQKSET